MAVQGGNVPLVIDYGTGHATDLPPHWSTEAGGKRAAMFAALIKARNPQNRPLDDTRLSWCAFRLMGTVNLMFEFPSEAACTGFVDTLRQPQSYVHPVFPGAPWGSNGDPAQGGLRGKASISRLTKSLKKYSGESINHEEEEDDDDDDVEPASEWQMRWLALVEQMNQPGGQWNAPFMLPIIPLDKVISSNNKVHILVQLYVSRLLFYLIADEALADIIRPLRPVGPVQTTFSVDDDEHPECFTQGTTSASPFSVQGIMRTAEHAGFPEATQPLEIALAMKPYQLQTLQWMLDQEMLPRGLNGCFWESRSWSPNSNSPWPSDSNFYVSTSLGEFRLEMPPLVRGGLLCEEMGLGKTLELVALIMATRSQPPTKPAVPEKVPGLIQTNATVVVVPDSLIAQWEEEIRKSCIESQQLKVYVYVQTSARGGGIAQSESLHAFVDCDICLTTFRTVGTNRTLQRLMWRRVVIDEMQMIRSSTTTVAKMCENLSAHARWMVSGTPLYTSVKDLNGLLNFLQVIPFSLADTKDGFWNQRLGKPLADNDPDALELLHFMLRRLMMRHSKAQRYKLGPLAGMSILQLPEMHRELVGVEFASYAEEAAFRQVEALALRAARSQNTSQERQRQDRPSVVAVDVLRLLAISPTLLTGGNGATGDMAKLARLWRTLLPASTSGAGIQTHLSSMLQGDFFANPVAMAGDKIRDLLLTKTASAGGNKSMSQNDVAMRLQQAQEDVRQNKMTLSFEKAGSFEGLPHRQWKWLFKCILSGQYHLIQIIRQRKPLAGITGLSTELGRISQECPVLLRRAVKSFGPLRQYATVQAALDRQNKFYMDMEPVKLMKSLGLQHEGAKMRQVEVSEGVFEDQMQLWFNTGFNPLLPTRTPSLFETVQAATGKTRKRRIVDEEEEAAAEGENESEYNSGEDDDDYSLGDDNRRATTNPASLARIRARDRQERQQQREADRFDFFAHESFWRKAFCKVLMRKHNGLKKEVDVKKLAWETMSHPPRESFPVRQLLHCAELHPDLKFEAVYWYGATAWSGSGKFIREWVRLQAAPVPFTNKTVRVRFRDGEERVVESTEVRLVPQSAEKPTIGTDQTTPSSTSTTTTTSMPTVQLVNKASLGLSEALTQLRLHHLRMHFLDLIGKENDLELALNLPEEDLSKRLLNDRDFALLQREATKETQRQKIRQIATARMEKFRQANLLRDAKQIKMDLAERAEEAFRALHSKAGMTSKLSLKEVIELMLPFCSKTNDEAVWGYLWRLGDGRRDGETAAWISVTLGLKEQSVWDESAVTRLRMNAPHSKLKAGEQVLVRIGPDDRYGSLGAGWFQAKCVKAPVADDLSKPPIWTVQVLGESTERDVTGDCVRPHFVNKNTSKKKKLITPDEDEESDEESLAASGSRKRLKHQKLTEEEEDADGSDDEDHEEVENEEDSNIAKLGFKQFPNGLIRVRFSVNVFHVIKSAKERVKLLKMDIASSKLALPDLERYESLLVTACERGGTAGAQLASQQGFQALEQLIENDPTVEYPKCTICLDNLSSEPVILGCLHLFCKECLIMQKKAHDASMHSHRPIACPLCRREINPSEMFLVLPPTKLDPPVHVSGPSDVAVDLTTSEESEDGERRNRPPQWIPAKDDEVVNKDFSRLPDGLDSWDGFSGRFLGLPRTLQTLLRVAAGVPILGCPSSTVPLHLSVKLVQLLKDIRAVDGKVVVCTQFSKAVSMLMTVFKREGISAVKVARGDKLNELSDAISTFNKDHDCKVLVLHSGSGAAGLTLTAARHIFLLEPFLRAGEEAQALNRVHRIGQTETVKTKCYFIRGTIEERLLAWRNIGASSTSSTTRGGANDVDDENALIVLGEDDQSKSVASLSNEFLSYVLGESANAATHTGET